MVEKIKNTNSEIFNINLETLKLLTQNSFDIISILKQDGTIIFENEALERLLAYNPENRIGKSVFQFVHPDDLESVKHNFTALEKDVKKVVYRIQHANGTWLWFESIGKQFEHASIKNGIIINSRDITNRVNTEKELKRSEQKYRNLIDHSPDILYRFSNKRGGIFYSSSIKDIMGFEAEELIEKPFVWKELIHPDDKEIVQKAIEDHNKGADYNIDYRIKTKAGNWIWLNDYFMHKYKQGDEIIIEGHASDITARKKIEDRLRKSEDRLSKVMLASNDGMWDWNLNTNEVYFDPQYYRMAGYEIDEFPHQFEEFEKRIHPEEKKNVLNQIQKNLNGDIDRFEVEFRFKHKNSGWLWIMGRGIIVEKDDNGKPMRFVGTQTDINKRKQTELVLQKNEQKFKALVSNTADGLVILHPEKGVKYVSPSYLKILGYAEEEELGRSVEDIASLIHPDERESVFQNIYTAINNQEEQLTYVYRALHKKGHYMWRRDKATFEYDENGTHQMSYVVCSDITREIKQKQLLDQQKNYLVAINKGSEIFQEGEIYTQLQKFVNVIGKVSNASRTYVFKNHKDKKGHLLMSQIAEYTVPGISAEINNPQLQALPYADTFPRWIAIFKSNEIISGKVVDFPMSERSIFESQDIKAILLIPIMVGNEFWGFIGFDNCLNNREWQPTEIEYLKACAEKISIRLKEDLKKEILKNKNKELEIANATKDRFLSVLGHDLRGPFNSILGLAELLIESIDEYGKDKIKELVEAIYDTSNDTYILLTNLLEWSKIQRDKLPFNPTSTNILQVVQKSFNPMQQAAKDKNIEFSCKIPGNMDIEADEPMLNTIIRNLINNAIKFTPENGQVIVSAKALTNMVEITITDTGVGMEEETIKSLFALDKSKTTHGTKGEKGTGFGLLLCKEFVDKHKGTINVESEIGKGTSFRISLPKKLG